MKHTWSLTALLLGFFFVSQIIGLGALTLSSDISYNASTNATEVFYEETAIGERPQVANQGALIYIIIGVGIGTALIFILRKFRHGTFFWKLWYKLAVILTVTACFGVVLPGLIAFFIGVVAAYFKTKNVWVHNASEVFMYAGLGLILAPLFSVLWAVVLLLAISLYDAYAVWQSKHMIKLAEFATKSGVFAGFSIPYDTKTKQILSKVQTTLQQKSSKKTSKNKKKSTQRMAILGGGDVVFPLLFSGAVLSSLLAQGYEKLFAFGMVLFVSVVVTCSLFLLFRYGKKDRFYPAMPFISAGCFVGYGLMHVVLFLL